MPFWLVYYFEASVKQENESIASSTLHLKQGVARCENDTFLDRMLIEQFLHCLKSHGIRDEIIAKKSWNLK